MARANTQPHEWPADRTERLTTLWDEGCKLLAISKILGVTKSMVLGKVHRLTKRGLLAARPSPIKPKGVGPSQRTAPHPKPKPLPSLVSAKVPEPPLPEPEPRQVAACCWPEGEPGTPGFRFCDAPSELGRPYCTEHVKLAYYRARDRREDVG